MSWGHAQRAGTVVAGGRGAADEDGGSGGDWSSEEIDIQIETTNRTTMGVSIESGGLAAEQSLRSADRRAKGVRLRTAYIVTISNLKP